MNMYIFKLNQRPVITVLKNCLAFQAWQKKPRGCNAAAWMLQLAQVHRQPTRGWGVWSDKW